jgi:hypothetical protein
VFVLRNPTDNENDRYISYQPKYNASLIVNKHYNDSFEELSLDIHEMYFKPDIVAIINKFGDIYNIVNEFLESDLSFYKQYEEFMTEYLMCSIEDRMGVFFDHAPTLINHIDMLFDKSQIEDQIMVKQDSSYKLNINLDDAKYILLTSVRSRFFIHCYLGGLAVDVHQQKVIHNMLSQELIEKGILNKFFNIVTSIVMATNPETTSKKLWGFLTRSKGYTYESQVIDLVSSVYYKALPSIQPQENPIAYLISVAKNELKWLMQTAMTNLFLPSTIDTVAMIRPKGDLIQSEIFYRVIVQKLFFPIVEDYKDYLKLYHYNVYVVLYNITQPLILAIFNLPLKNINISNVHVLNFFTHKFLKQIGEMPRPNMEKLLLSAPMPNYDMKKIDKLPDNLIAKIASTLKPYFITKKITHLTLNTIKKYYITTILNLYKYRYLDVITEQYHKIDWSIFIEELISFSINLTIGTYNSEIEKIKKTLNQF